MHYNSHTSICKIKTFSWVIPRTSLKGNGDRVRERRGREGREGEGRRGKGRGEDMDPTKFGRN